MPKPVTLPRWANLAAPGDLVDPPSGKKDSGWLTSEKPPHSYFNWFQNLVYQWTVYLDGLTGEALTWTALHIFSSGIYATNTSGTAGTFDGGASSGSGVFGTGGAPNGIGVRGIGAGAGVGVSGVSTASSGVFGRTTTGAAGVVGESIGAAPGVFGSSTATGPGGSFAGAGTASGLNAVGAGPGSGVSSTGGATSGTGVKGFGGAPNGIGVEGLGTGTGSGVSGESTASNGVFGRTATATGVAGEATGSGRALAGTSLGAGTAGYLRSTSGMGMDVEGVTGGRIADSAGLITGTAISIEGSGNIAFGGPQPASTQGFSNKVNRKNICKAWGQLTNNGLGVVAVADGFNIASTAINSVNFHRVTFTSTMASNNYAVVATMLFKASQAFHLTMVNACNLTTSSFDLTFYRPSGVPAFHMPIDTGFSYEVSFIVYAPQ